MERSAWQDRGVRTYSTEMNKIKKAFSAEKIRSGSFLENSSSILLTRMSFSCSSLLVIILIARKLGPDQLGLFSVVMGFCTIFQLICALGYDTIVIRDIAKDQNKGAQLIQHGVVLGLCSSLICALLMGVFAKALNYSPAVMRSIGISSIVLYPCFLNLLAETVFIGIKKSKFAFYTAIVREASWFGLSIWALSISADINLIIESFIGSRIIGVVLFVFFLKDQQIHWLKGSYWLGLKQMINLIPTFLLINVLSNLLLELDVIILSKFVPLADVGFYNVTKKILRVSFILIFSMVMAWFPTIVEAVHKNRGQVRSYFRGFSVRMSIVSISIAVSICIAADPIVHLFLGAAFMPSVKFIHILIWKIVPLSLSFLWSRFLIAAHQQNKDALALIFGLLLFLVLSIAFIKRWGTIGMAYADVLTLTCLAGIHLYLVDRTVFRVGGNV